MLLFCRVDKRLGIALGLRKKVVLKIELFFSIKVGNAIKREREKKLLAL